MGASLQPLILPLVLKGMVLENKGLCKSSSGFLRSKVLAAKCIRRSRRRRQRILMKRRTLLEGSRRPMNGMKRRIRILKKLVPNGKEFMSLDGLFRETADYILCLQMQVKVMQKMVKDLSGSNNE